MTTLLTKVHDYYGLKKEPKFFLQQEVKKILCCDWQPEQGRWAYLACLGFPAWVPKIKTIIIVISSL